MKHPIRAWVLEEKTGGRKGKWMKGEGVPFFYPIKTALFHTRDDALRYIINTGTNDKYNIVMVDIYVKRRADNDIHTELGESDQED